MEFTNGLAFYGFIYILSGSFSVGLWGTDWKKGIFPVNWASDGI